MILYPYLGPSWYIYIAIVLQIVASFQFCLSMEQLRLIVRKVLPGIKYLEA